MAGLCKSGRHTGYPGPADDKCKCQCQRPLLRFQSSYPDQQHANHQHGDAGKEPALPATGIGEETEGRAGVVQVGETEDDKVLLVEPDITVHELARMVKIRTAEIVKTLMFMGEMVPGGGEIPAHAIEPLGRELGWEILVAESDEEEEEQAPEFETISLGDDIGARGRAAMSDYR